MTLGREVSVGIECEKGKDKGLIHFGPEEEVGDDRSIVVF